MQAKVEVHNSEGNEAAIAEKPLNEVLQPALGDDPNTSKAKKVQIHSILVNHWKYYALNGMKKENRQKLINKYEIPSGLTAPGLNDQLQANLSDKAIRRDGYRYDTQKSVSAALTA